MIFHPITCTLQNHFLWRDVKYTAIVGKRSYIITIAKTYTKLSQYEQNIRLYNNDFAISEQM